MAGAKAKTGPASAGLRLLTLITALAPAPAAAGAWVAPEGGQSISTSVVGERDDGIPFYETSLYLEAPINDETSLVFSPWTESNHEVIEGWRGEALVAAKHVVYRSENTIAAVQAGALWVSHPDEGCSEGGAEARLLGGRSFADGRAFANVEVGTRALSGGCEGNRAELTFGYHPSQNWLAIGQVFADAPVEGDDTLKAQLTVVRFGRRGRGIQVGLRARIDGGAAEPALVVGLWSAGRD